MKTQQTKLKIDTPQQYTIRLQMLGGKRAAITMTDQRQARDYYDQLRNQMIFAGEAIRLITFE